MKPLISVVIVSYNTQALTLRCLKHLFASKGIAARDLEVILVDNQSTDKTVREVGKHYPQVQIIQNHANLGFGQGNNEGFKVAKGEYILLLNTDAFVGDETIKTLVDIISQDHNISSVSPQLRYESGDIQPSAGYFPTLSRVIAWMWWLDKLPLIKNLFGRPYHVYDPSSYATSHHFDWLMGACVLFRTSELKKIGGFDQHIFMYCEEVELYLRLYAQFHKTNLLTTTTKTIHLGSASTTKAAASRLVLELEGIKHIYKTHYPQSLSLVRVILYSGVMLRRLIFMALPGREVARHEYAKYTF